MPNLKLDTPLFEALGAKNVFLKRLEKLGVKTIGDLLRHFPSRYEDFSHTVPIAELTPGEETTAQGVVRDVRVKYTRRRGLVIIEAFIEDETGSILGRMVQPAVPREFPSHGARRQPLRKDIRIRGWRRLFQQSLARDYGDENEDGETMHTGRLVPIYPETRGLTSRGIRFLVANILKRDIQFDEWIPADSLPL